MLEIITHTHKLHGVTIVTELLMLTVQGCRFTLAVNSYVLVEV